MTQSVKEAAKSWSSTLRLPKSAFPPRATPADLSKYLQRCTDDLYTWQNETRAKRHPFILHDGPPYANGDLHVGHALNKILKDIINRTKLQQGDRIEYVPGWDCHGLPIEQKAFEHHGWTVGNRPDAVKVRNAAASFAGSAVEKQMAGFRSWGIMGAWGNHWKTMDHSFELAQLRIFQAMARHGLVYRRHKPVYWSPSSRTALAEAELEYKEDHISKAALVKFRLNNANNTNDDEPVSLLIWTTTPWTLPANQAIAINRQLEYAIVISANHGLLLLAVARLEAVEAMLAEKLIIKKRNVDIDNLLASCYQGLPAFDETERPIIHADFVSAEAGTGLVHCAPGHGMEDYEALQPHIRSGIVQVKAPVDEEGNFTVEASPKNPDLLQGRSVFGEGNASVIASLRHDGSLLIVHDYKHKYPYDWRTKQPILVLATAQWFTDLGDIKGDALKALEVVQFRPETGESRLRSFIENRSEWCISRQRSWGVPIPALYHRVTGEAILSDLSVSHIVDVISKRGTDAWWSDSAEDAAWISPKLDPSQYVRGTDTMDVWFDSGTSWAYMSRDSHDLKIADICLEGTDQHRGWFQSSLLTNIAYQNATFPDITPTAPYKQLITHGFTLDGAGKKMSKSIGNVISPDQIITGEFEVTEKITSESTSVTKSTPRRTSTASKKRGHAPGSLGPDALRLWVASSDWSKDVVVSETIVKTVHASLHKYRVTFKMLLGALEDFQMSDALSFSPSQLSTADRLALLRLYGVSTSVRHAFDNFEYHKAVAAINKWINTDLSAFYIEAIKDTLYCDRVSANRRRKAQVTLFLILRELQCMLTPLTPILVEESWEHFPEHIKALMIHPLQMRWQGPDRAWYDELLEKDKGLLFAAINTACKVAQERARSEKRLGSSLESECLIHLPNFSSKDDPPRSFRSLERQLKEILVVSSVTVFNPPVVPTADLTNSEDLRKWAEEAHKLVSLDWQARLHQAALQEMWSYVENFTMPDGQSKGFVVVYPPVNAKCPRCWHYAVEAKDASESGEGSHPPHDDLCPRCRDAVGNQDV